MARAKAAAAPRSPTVVQRTVRTVMRMVSWIVIAWLAFYLVRIAIGTSRTHQSFSLGGWVLGLAISLPIGAVEVAVVAAALSAMVIVPYAYVVWPQPQRRFWTEDLPWSRTALFALGGGVLIALVYTFAVRPALGASH